jgi:hypothetical protein
MGYFPRRLDARLGKSIKKQKKKKNSWISPPSPSTGRRSCSLVADDGWSKNGGFLWLLLA